MHIIDGVEHKGNPLTCPIVAEALVMGEYVTVIDDWGTVTYEGSPQEYAYGLLNSLQSFSVRIDEHKCEDDCITVKTRKKGNVIYLDSYRK